MTGRKKKVKVVKSKLPPVWIVWYGDSPTAYTEADLAHELAAIEETGADETDEPLLSAHCYLPRRHAEINKGNSPTVVGTPRKFVDFVEVFLGTAIWWDLAAVAENCVVAERPENYYGPDHADETMRDALAIDWVDAFDVLLWLNPPYDNIRPWVAKCCETIAAGFRGRIACLVPSSVGSGWYEDHVEGKCHEFQVGRLPFVGYGNGSMKDHMLLIYEQKPAGGYVRQMLRDWKDYV